MNSGCPFNPLVFDPSFEKIQDDEDATIQELVETLQEISDVTSKDYGHAVRSVLQKPLDLKINH